MDTQSNNRHEYLTLRRELRTNGTSAEATMWSMLKSRQIDGCKFRRQFSIGAFILDFYCPQKKLAIELDGNPHFTEGGNLYDQQRDEILNRQYGIYVLRFENELVYKRPEDVIDKIREALKDR